MKKEEIIDMLKSTCDSLIADTQNINNEEFFASKNNKWSAAQNFAHLTLSAKIINRALAAPKIALWYKFGRKFKGGSRDYQTIVDIYITENAKPRTQATGFEPRMKPDANLESEKKAFVEIHDKLIGLLGNWSEKQLNTYLLPHPLIGKLTISEMMGFVDYHIKHHEKGVKIALEK